jgi:oligopeptide/dipeptide ABC transporter ATP-binding protein
MTFAVPAPVDFTAPPPALLEVRDLAVHFIRRRGLRRTVNRALDGVSFTLAEGETLGIVGESGSGKSTLLLTLLGIHTPIGGSISLNGRRIDALSSNERRALRNEIQPVFQNPASALNPGMTIHELIAEPLRIAGRYKAASVHELLDNVGLARTLDGRVARELSGGQLQRVSIARALALRPRLLLLDEPVSALDASIRAQIINLLQDLQAEFGLSYLFIAHDLSVVRHLTHRIAVMYLGRFVEAGETADVFAHAAHPYTRGLMAAMPRFAGEAPPPGAGPEMLPRDAGLHSRPESGCRFRPRCPLQRPACADGDLALGEYTPGRHAAACLAAPDAVRAAVPNLADRGDALARRYRAQAA